MNSMSSEKARSNRTEALVILALSAGVGLLLSGCGSPAKVSSTPVVPAAQGVVHGGQQPVAGVSLQLYTTGNSNYGTSASGFGPSFTSTAHGNFNFPVLPACPAGNPEVFLEGTGGTPIGGSPNPNLALMVGLGPCNTFVTAIASPSYYVTMNELTTVATVWSVAGFITSPTAISTSSTNATGLANAFAVINEIVDISTGTAPGKALPGTATLTTDKVNALADILQNCVNSAGGSASDTTDGLTNGTPCGKLFFLTTTPTANPPTPPQDTITAAFNIATYPGGGVVNVSDANYLQYLFDLQPIPTTQAFPNSLAGPPSLTDWTLSITYTGSAFTSPQSLAVDASGNVWVTNKPSSGKGSVTELTIDNTATTTPAYIGANYTQDVDLPSAIAIDTGNNAWVTNTGDNSLTVFAPGGASHVNYNNSNTSPSIGLNTPEAVAIDGAGNIWVANNGNNTVSGITYLGAVLPNTPFSGGGLSGPTSIAVNPIAPASSSPAVVRKRPANRK